MSSKILASILTLDDRMSPKLVGVSAKVASMSKEMQRATQQSANMSNKIGSNMMKMTDKIVKAGIKWTALTAIASAGVVFKIGFEGLKELDNVSAKIKSIAPEMDKKTVASNLLKTSNKTGVGVEELGTTQYDAISSGVSAKNSLEASVVSAKLAKAGFTDSDSALKALMSTMNVYGLTGTKAMTNISDKMLVVQNLGVITVAEMAESMGSVTPVAQACGASIDELDAGMISLTKNGIKADEASVQMKGIFTSIIKPSSEASKEAKSLGLNFSASALKAQGFAKFMENVKEKTGGSTEKMAKLFGNVRALTGALVLSGTGFKDFNSGLVALKDSSGMTESAFAIMQNTVGAKFDKLKNTFKNTCTSIVATQSGTLGTVADKMITWLNSNQDNIQKYVDNIGKAITKIFKFIKDVVDFVVTHKTAIENFALAFASFYIAVKAVMALKIAIDVCKVAFGLLNGELLLTPLGWLVLAIAGAIFIGVKLYQNWDLVKKKAGQLWDKMKDNPFVEFVALTNPLLGILFETAKHFDAIKSAIQGVIDKINEMRGIDTHVQVPVLKTVSTAEKVKSSNPVGAFGYTTTIKASKTPLLDKYIGGHALGSNYFDGGATKINERGGEMAILPSGSKIIPADKTNRILDNSKNGIQVFVTIQGNVIGNEEYADYVGEHIVEKVKLKLSNI
ncbi:phage tail tape measure protein [Clostridium estertheticum]|uniref:phage tail tape measure protein n=1 Tax=Clostridium estertheticum TaxID=238834 RepID=UPI001C6E341F|nr:phage tail tape measure protein [Clostridium estertheticum]MBW9170781.1 phage tail tape measure protein [Clostridium estertheticum]WLC74380.1 phage tail tape measure protein [Clostridium estertheticum]